MTDRVRYDPSRDLLFLNFQHLHVRQPEDVETIRRAVDEACERIGHRVAVVVGYDGFQLDHDVADVYARMVHDLQMRRYSRVSRYAGGAFRRMTLAKALTQVEVPPFFETESEAREFLERGEP
jgi:propionate CoA-transferase